MQVMIDPLEEEARKDNNNAPWFLKPLPVDTECFF